MKTLFTILFALLFSISIHAWAADTVVVQGTVIDADSGAPIPCRIHIEGPDGTYYPPEGHVLLPTKRNYNSFVDFEPDVINIGYGIEKGECWAVLEDGAFTVELPAIDDIQLVIMRGIEYERGRFGLDLASASTELTRSFKLKRGYNRHERGWMNGDTHVHNLTPSGCVRQMPIEDIDYTNLMFMGPQHKLFLNGYVTGVPDKTSTEQHIVHVSQEVRDAQQGHMTLLNMKEPIKPVRGYTGTENEKTEPRPHEPLNWDVCDEMHRQGGLAFHAHYTHWPGYASPVEAALGKIDGFEFSRPDIVVRGETSRQNIEVPGYPLTGGGKTWYHELNCGARVPLCGGTDKMSASRVIGGGVRTYAKVDEFSAKAFINALDNGATYVTNGPLLEFTVNGQEVGSDIQLQGEGPFTVQVNAACYTEWPVVYFEVIKNGEVIHNEPVDESVKRVNARFELNIDKSCWLALRVGNKKYDPEVWGCSITAAHTSPIYVTVNDTLPAVKESAEFMVARTKVSKKWCETVALYSSDENKQKAMQGYEAALAFYENALSRATQ